MGAPIFHSSLPLGMSFFQKGGCALHPSIEGRHWTTWVSHKNKMLFKTAGYRKARQLLLKLLFKNWKQTQSHTPWGHSPQGWFGKLEEGRLKTRPHKFITGSCNFNWDPGLSDSIFFFFVEVKSGQVYSGLFSQSLSQSDENCLWTWRLCGKRTN